MPRSALNPDTVLELREQFATADQQRETSSVGMWVFLITEVMLFGGLFTAFTVYRLLFQHSFDIGSSEMETTLGAINTAVLICSSLTMALAVHSGELGRDKLVLLFLGLTMVIGMVFLGIKLTEYYDHWLDHKVPGFWFEHKGADGPHVQLFFVFYFIMTGLHALHMTIGICILGVLFCRSLLGQFSAEYHTPIDLGGLYWHFIDIVWVFLYAIFYMPGFHLK